MIIRPATVADARGIAIVHVRSWQNAYRGLMPQPLLDVLDVDQRTSGWQRWFAEQPADVTALVAEHDGAIVGMATCGTARDNDPVTSRELHGIYVLPEVYGTGVGHELISAVEQRLREAGHESAYLWVLEGNVRAANFYKRHGWHADGGTKIEERPDATFIEHRHVKQFPGG